MSDRKNNRAGAVERRLEELKRVVPKPPTWQDVQEVRKRISRHSNDGAQEQVWRAVPPGEREPSPVAELNSKLSAMGFYGTFLPSDGHNSALARLMVGATNAAMDCFARAGTSNSSVRAMELNLASKLSLTVATLSKALDSHRGSDWPDFLEEFVADPGNR